MVSPKVQYLVIALIGICVVFTTTCIEGAPMPSSAYYNEVDATPEDVLFELLQRFGKTILRARNDLENSKRTVDFGLARGYSGIQEAKHRMGLAAANFAGGPGRKRRSLLDV